MKRIFITGYGFLGCLGETKEKMHHILEKGEIRAGIIKRFSTDNLMNNYAFEIRDDINYIQYIPASLLRRMDNPQKYLIYSAMKALEDAGMSKEDAKTPAIFAGTSFGGTDWTERFFVDILSKGPKFANPQYFPPSVPNAAAGQLSILLENRQKNHTFCHKEVSGEMALYTAIRDMRYKGSDSGLVVGFEELGLFVMLAFEKMRVLLKKGGRFSPFIARDGFIMGEGSAAVILETGENIEKRGFTPIAEITGIYSASSNAGIYEYPRERDFYVNTMENALKSAGISYSDLNLVISCANSGILDEYERDALVCLNKKHGADIPVFAPKGYTGEFYGSGIMRLAIALLSMEKGIIYPHSWIEKDPGYGIDIYRTGPLKRKLDNILINSFSNGGSGISYIIKRYE